jgi:hypothetical protein
VDVLAGEVIGVFAHVQRAHEDRALRFHVGDERRVRLGWGVVAVDARACQRDLACDVVEVLHREESARQRAAIFAPCMARIESRSLRTRTLRSDAGEGAQRGIMGRDARQRRLDHLSRSEGPGLETCGGLSRRDRGGGCAHGV